MAATCRDDWFVSLLACPDCVGEVRMAAGALACAGCGRGFGRTPDGVLEMLPRDYPRMATPAWTERQALMEDAYLDLARDPAHVARAYGHDFGGQAAIFASVRGPVLDIGGGHGLVRDYLPGHAPYVSIDPSTTWFADAWSNCMARFPSLQTRPVVRAIGERIPFRTSAFETVLAYWVLNHAIDPRRVVQEAWRVLKKGGRLVMCLEDMEPSWRDIAAGRYRPSRTNPVRSALMKLRSVVAGWPLQPDHARVEERDVRRWIGPYFELLGRQWFGPYLTLDLRARANRSGRAQPAQGGGA